eukprot:jgi/Bigna1/137165/aug1.37_g11873
MLLSCFMFHVSCCYKSSVLNEVVAEALAPNHTGVFVVTETSMSSMDTSKLMMIWAPAVVVLMSGSSYQVVLLAALYMAIFTYFEVPFAGENEENARSQKRSSDTSDMSLLTSSSDSDDNPLVFGKESSDIQLRLKPRMSRISLLEHSDSDESIKANNEPAKKRVSNIGLLVKRSSLLMIDEKEEEELKARDVKLQSAPPILGNDEMEKNTETKVDAKHNRLLPRSLSRLSSLPKIASKRPEPAAPMCPLEQDESRSTGKSESLSLNLGESQEDSLSVRSQDSTASRVSIMKRSGDPKQGIERTAESGRLRIRLPAKDLGYDLNMIESFVETIEKMKPSDLATMMQLRASFLQYKKKVETSNTAGKKAIGEEGACHNDNGDLDDVDVSSGEDDAEENKEYVMAKHRKGFFRRLLHLGSAHSDDSLLTFKKSLIKKSLLKCNRDKDDIAIQTFKNIMSFMQDRSTSKSVEEHAQKLVSVALLSEQQIRDEIFMQIIKQTNGHPNMDHCLLGWSLLLICLVSFQPSKHIHLQRYIGRAIRGPNSSAAIKERARLARRMLDLIGEYGERSEAPSGGEIRAIMQMELIPVTVRIPSTETSPNRASVEINVDPFWTVAEAEEVLLRKLDIHFTPGFGLCQANDHHQEPLLGGRRVMDVISSWQGSLCEESSPRSLSPSPPRTRTKGRENTVHHRRVMSVPTSLKAIRKRCSLRRVGGKDRAGSRRSLAEPSSDRYQYLLFQSQIPVNISGSTRSRRLLRDERAIDLMYCQAMRDVMQGRAALEKKDLIKLASLKLFIDQGEYEPSIHVPGSLVSDLQNYLPRSILPKNMGSNQPELEDLGEQILHKYKRLVGVRPQRAKIKYLEYAERSPMYGTQVFRVMQNRQLKWLPDFINLGVSSRGVVLQNPDTKEVTNQYTMKEIVTWGQSPTKFLLVIGDVIQQRKFTFKTPKGLVIKRLIQSGIQIQVFETMDTRSVAEGY